MNTILYDKKYYKGPDSSLRNNKYYHPNTVEEPKNVFVFENSENCTHFVDKLGASVFCLALGWWFAANPLTVFMCTAMLPAVFCTWIQRFLQGRISPTAIINKALYFSVHIIDECLQIAQSFCPFFYNDMIAANDDHHSSSLCTSSAN